MVALSPCASHTSLKETRNKYANGGDRPDSVFFDYHSGTRVQLDIHLSRLLANDIIRESAQTRCFAAQKVKTIPRTALKRPTVNQSFTNTTVSGRHKLHHT